MRQTMNKIWLTSSLALGIAFGQSGLYIPLDFPGASSTLAWGINNRGDISGQYVKDGETHGFKLAGGQFSTLDYPGSAYTQVYGINNRGDVAGLYRNADGVTHGFTWIAGQFAAVDYPNAVSTQCWGIGPAGDTVGAYGIAGVTHGFKLSGKQFVTLDFPGSTATILTGINPQGEISGIYTLGGLTHGLLVTDGELTSLDVPGAAAYTNATGLTARGEIIGRYLAGTVGYGYLMRGSVFSTIAFPGATFTGAAAMNERGEMVGRYQNADGVFHGFLLVPDSPRVALTAGGAAVTHASDYRLVTAENPAAPGELLTLFATGLGPTRPGVEPGKPFPSSPLATVTLPVEVRANGTPAEVLAAVGIPGAVGGYQVNFRLPANTLKGLASLQVSAGMIADTSVKVMVK